MKKIIAIVLVLVVSLGIAQTKLIRHKSHSGTNDTFKPAQVEGNYGLPEPEIREIKKDEKSKYKLIRTEYIFKDTSIVYTLFKKTEESKQNYLEVGDTPLASISLSSTETRAMATEIEELLVQKLDEFRAKEKE